MADENVFELMWPGEVITPGQSGMLLAEPEEGAAYTWDVLLVDSGAEPGPEVEVVAEATLVEVARFPFRGYDPAQSVLNEAGITSMESDVIAGLFHTTEGDELVLSGIAKVVVLPPLDPGDDSITIHAFVPYALADDLGSAIQEAEALSWLLYTASAPGGKGEEVGKSASPLDEWNPHLVSSGDRDCAKELSNCKAAAELRRKAKFKTCAAATAVGLTACASGCCLSGPYYVACVLVCGAGVITGEHLCMSAANDECAADELDCSTAYDQCCAENWCPPKE